MGEDRKTLVASAAPSPVVGHPAIGRDPNLDAIYAEGEPIIWLRVDLYGTAREAKRVAWSGRGIPWGFSEEGTLLKELKVSRVWMRDDGAKHGYDQWWTQVNVTDVAGLTEFFRVEIPAALSPEETKP